MKTSGLVFRADLPFGSAAPDVVTLLDRSRYKNNGAMTNVSWLKLPSGLWVMDFTAASNNQVNIGNFPEHDFTYHSFTTVIWVNLLSNVTLDRDILARGTYNSAGWFLYLSGDRRAQLYVSQSGAAQICEGLTIPLNTWIFLTHTRAGTVLEAYINSVAGHVYTQSATNPVSFSGNMLLGARTSGGASFRYGYLSSPRVFNYALTPAQIWQIYQNERSLYGV